MAEQVRLNAAGQTEEEFVREYQKKRYPFSYLTADVLLFYRNGDEYSLLMIRRGDHPYIGMRALPGGFVDREECAKEAALRELQEETGVEGITCASLGFYSDPHRDPRGWIITEAFYSIVSERPKAVAADDARDARWFRIIDQTEGDCMKLTLKAEDSDEVLTIEGELSVNPQSRLQEVRVTASSGFGFDHDQVVADGWLACLRVK